MTTRVPLPVLLTSPVGGVLVAALLGAGLLLVGCGGHEDADAAPDTTQSVAAGATPTEETRSGQDAPEPCGLLSVEEVSAAVGAVVGDGATAAVAPPTGGEACTWTSTSGPTRTFRLELQDGGDAAASAPGVQQRFDDAAAAPGVEPVAGVGDRAVESPTSGYVLKGDVLMTLRATGTPGTALPTLAAAAAGRL